MDAAHSFGRKHYSAKNGTLIVVGNFDVEKVKRSIRGSFGEWGGGHRDAPISVASPQRSGPEYIGVIDKEGSPQMTIGIAYPGPAGVDGQEAARTVLTEMLKLRMATVRTELGSTYGIAAGRTSSVGPNSYRVQGSVDAPRAGESLKFIRTKLDELRAGCLLYTSPSPRDRG